MPNLSSIPVLDVAVGLAFMYMTLSIICSSVSELFASALKLRSKNLETGVRAMLGSKAAADKFFDDWRITQLGTPKRSDPNKVRNARKPSYLPPRTAALVILDTFAPDVAREGGGPPSKDARAQLAAKVSDIDNDRARAWLANILAQAEGDADKARAQLETSFNDVMARAAGWYKRKVQLILLVIALIVAVGLNADTLNVADRLSRDDAIRAAVVAQAQKAAKPAAEDPTAATVQRQINAARATALPLGWGAENVPHGGSFWGIAGKVFGILLTTAALMLGAPFWFDLLGKVSRIRSTGGKPPDPPADDDKPNAAATKPV